MSNTTREQDIIISRMADYKMAEAEWNGLTKNMSKPVWIGKGASEEIRNAAVYQEKYEYALNAVLEALNVSLEDAEQIYQEYTKSWMTENQKQAYKEVCDLIDSVKTPHQFYEVCGIINSSKYDLDIVNTARESKGFWNSAQFEVR